MQQAQFSGVRNLEDKAQVLTCDGQAYPFEAKEVKILPAPVAQFAASRLSVSHPQDKDGRFVGVPSGKHLFELVPLHEALKVAKLEEDPSILSARKRAEEEQKQKAALAEEIKKMLLAEGWKPPTEKNQASKKDKEA